MKQRRIGRNKKWKGRVNYSNQLEKNKKYALKLIEFLLIAQAFVNYCTAHFVKCNVKRYSYVSFVNRI